jgi:hypothetical protein
VIGNGQNLCLHAFRGVGPHSFQLDEFPATDINGPLIKQERHILRTPSSIEVTAIAFLPPMIAAFHDTVIPLFPHMDSDQIIILVPTLSVSNGRQSYNSIHLCSGVAGS